MARVEVYVHEACASSRALLEALASRGLLGGVEVVDVALPGPSGALRVRAWSVPWVVVDGQPAAADPVDPGEVEAALEGRRLDPPADPVEAFMTTVLYSGYASTLVAVHGSLEPVLDPDLASAAVRAPLTGVDPHRVLELVEAEAERLYGKWIDRLARVAALAVARAVYWATGPLTPGKLQELTEGQVAALLLALASLGRAGVPPHPPREAGRVAGFLRRAAAGIARKVNREQEQLKPGWLRDLLRRGGGGPAPREASS